MKLPVLVLAGLGLAGHAIAVEPKVLKDVDVAALTRETQLASYGDGGTHVAWWVPGEYWESSLMRDASLDPAARKYVLDILRRYSLLAVAQTETSATGSMDFYSRDRVLGGMTIEYSNGGAWREIKPLAEAPKELSPLLDRLTPIMRNALGQLGESLYFFVISDVNKGERVISPLSKGQLRLTLTRRDGVAVGPLTIDFPLDSLFVPRLCPNGKPAHVTWAYCPWDGTRLPL